MWSEAEPIITGTMVKDYMFCPSIFYYKYILRILEPETEMMSQGKKAFTDIEHKAKSWRTVLGMKRVRPDRVIYSARVRSERYGLAGIVDVVYWVGGKCIVLEIKESDLTRPESSHIYQAAIYGLMAEETFETTVSYIEIYYTLSKAYRMIRFTPGIRRYSKSILNKIWGMLNNSYIPEPRLNRRCHSCWYRARCYPSIRIYK